MKEFLQAIFKSTEDRIKNPFVGAFITSWVVFNWKPILYIIFEDETIKKKIDFIRETENYINIENYLWLPLLSSIFYVGILPYVSFLFEFIVKFSHKWRNKVSLEARDKSLELQIGIAKNEITLEEKKTEFRERHSHNQMVEGLQEQIRLLNEALEEASKSHIESMNVILDQKSELTQEILIVHDTYNEKISGLNQLLSVEKIKTAQLTQSNSESEAFKSNSQNIIRRLEQQLSIEQFKMERLKQPMNKIITANKTTVLEYFNLIKEASYFNLTNLVFIDLMEFKNLIQGIDYTVTTDLSIVNSGIDTMSEHMSSEDKKFL